MPRLATKFLTLWAALLIAEAVFAQQAETVRAAGLIIATLKTPEGAIQLHLPDDTGAGGAISGTVVAEPAGNTVEERARNQDTLNGYVMRLENEETRISAKLFQRSIRSGTKTLEVILLDQQGRQRSRAALAIPPVPPLEKRPPGLGPGKILLPTAGQAGRPLQIPGNGVFDGNSTTTAVKIGGKDASVVAESSRKTVVECPHDVAGPTQFEMNKNEFKAEGDLRVVNITLTAPQLNLRSAQQTTLAAEVSGLQSLQEDLHFRLQNRTQSVVRMAGGDDQDITISPREVQQGGVYRCTRTLTGIRPGAFNIVTALAEQAFQVIGERAGNPRPQPPPASTTQQTHRTPATSPPQRVQNADLFYRVGDVVYYRGQQEEYFLPTGIPQLDRAMAQKWWASPNPLPGITCCCCWLWGLPRFLGGPATGAGPAARPPAGAGAAPISVSLNLGMDKFGPGKAIHVLYAVNTAYVGEAYIQWNAFGGQGQLTVDLEVQGPGSSRWDKLASGRGPNDEHLFSTNRPGTYLFRATAKDSAGNSMFNTLSVTFPRI